MNFRYFFFFICTILVSACNYTSDGIADSSRSQKSTETSQTVSKKMTTSPESSVLNTRMTKEFLHGTWQNIDHEDIDLILHLNIVDDLVLGEYCSKAKNFFLEDCSLEDEGSYCSVRGPFNQFSAEVGLESCLNAEIGEAFIRRENENLKLILDNPAGEYAKDHLVPDTTILRKISNEPYF